jgi:hypothetical protein
MTYTNSVRNCLVLVGLATAASVSLADTLIDRGLPSANLNNIAGSNRSNVSWGYPQNQGGEWTTGDDFTLGATGDVGNPVWRLDTIRVWITAGPTDSAFSLSDRYANTSLYLKNGAGPVSLAKSGTFTGGNATNNPDISISQVQYAGGLDYQGSSGAFIRIWQVDFTNLNLTVTPGDMVQFFPYGQLNVPNSGQAWFNHASNAALSGTTQQGADNLMSWLDINDLTSFGAWDSNAPNTWDKSSDINVQAFGAAIPAPGSLALLGLGGIVAIRRRR